MIESHMGKYSEIFIWIKTSIKRLYNDFVNRPFTLSADTISNWYLRRNSKQINILNCFKISFIILFIQISSKPSHSQNDCAEDSIVLTCASMFT